MRIINKKYLLIIILVGIILTGVIFLKPKENVKLDNVVLKQEVNNKTFAMYKEDGEGYTKVEENKFPDMYVLNLTKSKCIDNNGNELDGVLSYENDKVTITSGNTTYCYLYFDKSIGEEIKEENPSGLKTEKVRGAMYRFQGQQNENVNNYICFGTSDKDTCTQDPDHHMYRIIGIEASTGRVKVIKMKTLKDIYQWWENYDDDTEFPDSKIYEAISGEDFLENPAYVPNDWKEKIADNIWMYGDMFSNDELGARQTGEGLYQTETGQKGTIWDEKAKEGDLRAKSAVVGYSDSKYIGDTVYYIRHENEKWNKTFNGKVSLMYLHDYYYSVSDEANCQIDATKYAECQKGWMHLSNNDTGAPSEHEWTMSRHGWVTWTDWFCGRAVNGAGITGDPSLDGKLSVRPVFYIDASQTLQGGIGTLENPFIIQE